MKKRVCMIPLILLLSWPMAAIAQEVNGAFEEWTRKPGGSERESVEAPVHWEYGAPFGARRSAEARSGSSALLLHNWYHYITGIASLGEGRDPGRDGMFLAATGVPVSTAPARLTGYYRYLPGHNEAADSAVVLVMLKRFDGAAGRVDTLSFVKAFLPPADRYTPFEIAIPAPRGGARPDSIAVAFISSDAHPCHDSVECHFLYLDDLALATSAGVPLPVPGMAAPASVYPNPARGAVSVRFDAPAGARHRLSVLDATGMEVRRADILGGRAILSTDDLPSGTYFVTVGDMAGERVANGRFVVD